MIDWKKHIISNEEILNGKPIIKGSRLSVEFIIERLADGWTEQEILDSYPKLTNDDLKAIYSYVYQCIKDGLLFMPKGMRA